MNQEIENTCSELLKSGEVDIILGYENSPLIPYTKPAFITEPEECDRLVFNNSSVFNLTKYIMDIEGKVGIFAKGCDYKGIVVLLKENKINREDIKIIGVGCKGQIDVKKIDESFEDLSGLDSEYFADKCFSCDVHNTPEYDVFVGDEVNNEPAQERYVRIEEFYKGKTGDEIWEFWQDAFRRCVRCYACREICPVCYCDDCISYENVPQWIDLSPTPLNNMIFHLRRAMCVAGRCVNCGECERVCPVDIPLTLLYNRVDRLVEELYDYRAGMDPEKDILLLSYSEDDDEDFIL